MKRRICALFMAAVMVLCLLPGAVFAAGEEAIAITTAEEFAQMNPDGNYVLTEDITVSAPYGYVFLGTFDGGGHTVELKLSGSSPMGLFASLGSGAHIKNLFIEGSVRSTASTYAYAGAVVGRINGLASGSIVIENCLSNADISGNRMNMGGILGQASVSGSGRIIIKGCGNTGNITGSSYVGGLIGSAEGDVILTDSYNRGRVTGTGTFGGLIGRGWYTSVTSLAPTIKNCYSTGAIVKGYNSDGGALFGTLHKNAEASNCYALEGCAAKLDTGGNAPELTDVEFKTEVEMKSEDFAALLGDGFTQGIDDYPAFSWQIPSAKVSFDILPEGSVLTVTDKEGKTVYSSGGAQNRTISLPEGDYTYDLTKEGYVSKTGMNFSVTESDIAEGKTVATESIELYKDESLWGVLSFNVSNSESYVIEIFSEGKLISTLDETCADRGAELLLDKEYTYKVTPHENDAEVMTKTAEFTETECIDVTILKVTGLKVKKLPDRTQYNQGDNISAAGMVITVIYNDDDNITSDISDVEFELFGVEVFGSTAEIGEAIACGVSYKGASAVFNIKVNEKPMPGEGLLDSLKGLATVEFSGRNYSGDEGREFVKTDKDGEDCLMSNVRGINYGEATMTIRALGNEEDLFSLSFDYKVSSEKSSWGTSVYDGLRINNGGLIGGEIDWTTHKITLKGGDEVTLSYVKDSGGNSGEDCVWLKNISMAKLSAFMFAVEPKDSLITVVKDGGDETVEASFVDNSTGAVLFYLADGKYDYKVSKFGYTSETGKINVPEDYVKRVSLQVSEKQEVSFLINLPGGLSAAETKIIVSYNGSAVEPVSDDKPEQYSLPDGDYTYVVTHPNCDDAVGSFTVSGKGLSVVPEMTRKVVFADFFEEMKDSAAATDASYSDKFAAVKHEDGNYLESTNKSGISRIELTFSKAGILDFKLWLSTYGSDYSNYYGLFIKHNDSTVTKLYGDIREWTDYSMAVNAGDKVTLEYYAYNYQSGYENLARFKDFRFTAVDTSSFKAAWRNDSEVIVTAPYAGTYSVVFAAYKDSVLIGAERYGITFEEAGMKILTPSEEFDCKEADFIKVMIWDSPENITPLCEAAELSK